MMSCRQCGTANENEAEKCRRCGQQLHAEAMSGKIPCVNHANRPATSTCNGCGRRLCELCAFTVDGLDFCRACVPEGAVASSFEEDYERLPVLEGAERASPGSRVAATLIDGAILAVIAGLLYIAFSLITGRWHGELDPRSGVRTFVAFWALIVLAGIAYHSIQLAMTGQTVGKRQAGVIVLTEDRMILSFRQALVRTLWALFSLAPLGLGCLWAFLHQEQDAWHDRLSKTYAYRYADTV